MEGTATQKKEPKHKKATQEKLNRKDNERETSAEMIQVKLACEADSEESPDWGSMDEDEKDDRKPSSSSSSSADNVAAPADAQVEAKHPPPPPPPPKRVASRSGGSAAQDQSRSVGPVAESRGSETVAPKPAPWYAALPNDMIIAAYVISPGAPRTEIESMLTDPLAHVSIVLTPVRDEVLIWVDDWSH